VLLAKTKEQPFGDLKGLAIALTPRRFRGYSEASVTTIANSLKTHLFDSPKTHTHTLLKEKAEIVINLQR
jgi:hypothetical protein